MYQSPGMAMAGTRRAVQLPRFVNWLTLTRSLHTNNSSFDSFNAVFDQLHFGSPVLVQTSPVNCVLYATATAIELLKGSLPQPPPFLSLSVPLKGIPMLTLHDSSKLQSFLSSLGLKTVPYHENPKSVALVRRALETGIVIAGLKINMFDDDNNVRSKSVKREFLNRQREPSGKFGNSMIDHSVCFVGYVEVKGQGYFITKDTQSPGELGRGDSGVSFLPVDEANLNELYVLMPMGMGTRKRPLEDS